MINTPFNYTGSKFKILKQILPNMDYNKKEFIDLFTGGGSVYVNILDKYERVTINDIIEDLVNLHKELNETPNEVIQKTKKLATCKEDKEKFLSLRTSYNEDKTPAKLWALMLSCTSNLMRFNKKFKFNQTWGKRGWNTNTDKKVKEYVDYLSKFGDNINYESKSFENIIVSKDSMVYIDPPYINTEAGYNSYWSKELENKLYDYILDIDKIGASFMVSGSINHNGKESVTLDKLSRMFNVVEIEHNYKKVSRKKLSNTKEVIIKNY